MLKSDWTRSLRVVFCACAVSSNRLEPPLAASCCVLKQWIINRSWLRKRSDGARLGYVAASANERRDCSSLSGRSDNIIKQKNIFAIGQGPGLDWNLALLFVFFFGSCKRLTCFQKVSVD